MTDTADIDIALLQARVNNIRHCKVLGIKVASYHNQQIILELPYSDAIIGNPETGVIHGGSITTLLDTACGFSVPLKLNHSAPSATLDLRIDHMTQGKPGLSVFAKAEVYRVTNSVIFTRATAYQHNEQQPLAHCVGTFMRLPHQAAEHGGAAQDE
jgi:uncharacterized protein (TIGR00369 family)